MRDVRIQRGEIQAVEADNSQENNSGEENNG